MARKNSVVAITLENGVYTFSSPTDSFTFDCNAQSSEIREIALFHGFKQKISDAAAIPRAELPDDPAETALIKFEAMKSVAERLMAGDWSKRSGDGSGPVAGLIYRAFEEWVTDMATKKKTAAPSAEAIRAVYDAKTRAEHLALRSVPAIAKIIERLKSERGASAVSTVDTSSLLSELGL